MLRVVEAAVAALVVAAALTAAWLQSALAVVFVWPLLFVFPGWAIVGWARPRIAASGRLGLAIVLSVALSTHLVYWLALATGGYRRETIFPVAALLALPIPLGLLRGGARSVRDQASAAWHAIRRDWLPFALAAACAGFVAAVLLSGLWRATPNGISAGGSNWSDLGVHLSIAQSLNAGNFPPEVPYFAGEPLIYHWFADFHAAIAARAAGIFSVPSFVVSSAILAGALALLVHGLARTLLRGRGARRAAALAVVLVVFAGGLGWVRLIGDVANGYGSPLDLISAHSYDNSWFDPAGQATWPYFRIPSVMGTGLLVHRATTAGLPMLVGAVLLLVAGLPSARARATGWRDRPALIVLAGLLGALLAPFHFFFFPAFLALALGWVVASGRLFDRAAPRNAALLLLPYLLAVPFAMAAVAQAGGSGALKWVAGWESAPTADGPWGVLFFYATNLGIPFLLALLALLLPRVPRRGFLAIWLVTLFLVPNVVQVSAIGFDMNKYFQAMWIAVALLAAWLIRRWPAPAIALVLLLSVPSPILVSGWTALNREVVLGWAEAAAADWIAANTPERSVFVTNGWLNSPTDPAGRLRVLTFTPYIANLGYSPDERYAVVDTIYCSGSPEQAADLTRSLGATYLLDSGAPRACQPTIFEQSPDWELVYDRSGVRIWHVSGAVASSRVPGSLSFRR
ncbi:MAG TPA: DUF2298 domain-containing protein [Candidatus Limnocylindria bacterium]|nr:DUF2298 domain-containing protein [Candidatus Limnocylindria bacterium]